MVRILIADDAITARVKLKGILIQAGYEVVGEAEDGLQAVNKYKESRPDIAIIDIVMPVMNGIEALMEIKRSDPSAKVIITSIMLQQEPVMQAVAAGASSYIEKPYEKERLLRAIEQLSVRKTGGDVSDRMVS